MFIVTATTVEDVTKTGADMENTTPEVMPYESLQDVIVELTKRLYNDDTYTVFAIGDMNTHTMMMFQAVVTEGDSDAKMMTFRKLHTTPMWPDQIEKLEKTVAEYEATQS